MLCWALKRLVHRPRQHAVARVNTFVKKLPPELEIQIEIGPMGNTTPRIGHFATEVITGCNARHPTQANKRYTKKDSGRPAIEMCTRKPASCDTGLVEAKMCDGGHSARSDQTLRLLCRGNVTGSASGPTKQHNISRNGCQSVLLLVDRGGSGAPRVPNNRELSYSNDCKARIQRRASAQRFTSTRMPSST